jgi:hypothetical protein
MLLLGKKQLYVLPVAAIDFRIEVFVFNEKEW